MIHIENESELQDLISYLNETACFVINSFTMKLYQQKLMRLSMDRAPMSMVRASKDSVELLGYCHISDFKPFSLCQLCCVDCIYYILHEAIV